MACGSLRIYLGASLGVGKTHKMLDEGVPRKERRPDVVIDRGGGIAQAETMNGTMSLDDAPGGGLTITIALPEAVGTRQ